MKIRISQPQCYSAQGKKSNQEDSLFPLEGKATKDTRVFMVCDGMGGHENGEVASACVAETVGKLTKGQPLCSTGDMKICFEHALQQAYCNLDELDHSDSDKKMGTTLTFLSICNDGVLVAHIGDSRVYQLRPGKGIIFQTRDHSLVNDLIASGELSEDQARSFPQRNVITRAIQPHQEYQAKASYSVLSDIRSGDLFFLCCDGVTEKLENKDICSFLLNNSSLTARMASLRNECEARETRDNNTAYLIEVVSIEDEDCVEVRTAEDDDTKTQNPPAKKEGWMPIVLVAVAVAVVVFLLYIFMPVSSNEPNMGNEDIQTSEQLQGTIQRHKK